MSPMRGRGWWSFVTFIKNGDVCVPPFLSKINALKGWKFFGFSPPALPRQPYFFPQKSTNLIVVAFST
jgi:hypothetical protein